MRTWWLPVAIAVECIACHVIAGHYERMERISQVDVIERNEVHSTSDGNVTLRQWILFDLDRKMGRETVVAWRIIEPNEVVLRRNGMWQLRWGNRIVRSTSYRHWHTEMDPEVDARSVVPVDRRRGATWK